MPGYSGLNCATRCPYPTYGRRCQGHCNCSNYTCDVSTGCRTLTTGQSYFPNRCLQFITCTFSYVFQQKIYCLYSNVKYKNQISLISLNQLKVLHIFIVFMGYFMQQSCRTLTKIRSTQIVFSFKHTCMYENIIKRTYQGRKFV